MNVASPSNVAHGAERPRAYATLLAASHLSRGMTLIESIFEHEDAEHRVFAVCLDDAARDALRSVRMPQLIALTMADVAPGAASVADLLMGLLAHAPEVETFVYLAPERFLTGPTTELVRGDAPVELWRVAPEGPIDPGLIVVRRSRGGERVLEAWSRASASGADDLAALEGVTISFDAARTFGPDDLGLRPLAIASGRATIEGRALLAFDAACVRMFSPELFSVETSTGDAVLLGAYPAVLLPYVDALSRAAAWERAVTGGVSGVAPASELSRDHELLTVRGVRERVAAHGLTHRCVPLSPVWDAQLHESRGDVVFDEALVAKRPPCPTSQPIADSRTGASVRVSALVSTYAAERVFRDCMEDLIGQTLFTRGELEILIIDSASPTAELSIALDYASRYPNIVVVRSVEREGVYMAWNRAAALARGRYLTNANTDDRHSPNALEVLADELDRNPETALVYADCDVTRQANATFGSASISGRFRWPDYDRSRLLRGCHIGPQPMWRRALHDVVGWFDARYVVAGDYDMWLRFAEHAPLRHVPRVLGLYLHRDDSVEHANADRCRNETISIVGLYRPRFDANPLQAPSAPSAPSASSVSIARAAAVAPSLPAARESSSSRSRESAPFSCTVVMVVPPRRQEAERALEAFVSNTPRYIPHEVVLALREPSAEVRAFLSSLSGDVALREFSADTDLLEVWRRSAEDASSDVVVLLDSGASATEGWLDPLLRGLEREPRNGAVAGRRVVLGATPMVARERIGAIAVLRDSLCSVPPASGDGATTHADAAVRVFRSLQAGGYAVAQEPRSSVLAGAESAAPRRATA